MPFVLNEADLHSITVNSTGLETNNPFSEDQTSNPEGACSALTSYLTWLKLLMFQWKIWWVLAELGSVALVQPAR